MPSPSAPTTTERFGFDPARLRARVAGRFFAVGLAVDVSVVGFFVANPEWIAYFYAAQFPVLSRLIFGVFFFGLGITYVNFLRLLWQERQLRQAVDLVAADATPAELFAALPASGIRDRLEGLLARPEHAVEGDPAGEQVQHAREETHAGWAKYITAVLTMLGLVGTFLGLMVAIDSIRGLTALQDKEAFFDGVVGALDGMGTAFSTSLAGIFGAVVLGFEQLVFHFAQLSYLGRVQVLVERVLAPQVESKDDAAGLAVELHRLRGDLRSWRTDAASAGAELEAAARQLGGQSLAIAEAVTEVLERVRANDDRWREVSEELAGLRRLAADENQALRALAAHRGAAPPPEGADAGEAVADTDAAEAPDRAVGADPAMVAELRRANDLLAHIYREMGMVLRQASGRLEMRQTEALQAIARVIQRMDAQAASGAEQVQMLRALLRYVNEDDRRLMGVMGVLKEEAARDSATPEEDGG